MTTNRWKVTLIVDLEEDSHPGGFIRESISMGLFDGGLADYEFEEVSNDFELLSEIND